LLDWYPFGGGFRLSAGARLNNNEVRLAGTPATAVQIGPTTYTPAQVGTLTGTITGQDLAPTLTLGYGGQLAKGFTMGVEVGAMLQGSPKLQNLQASGLLAQNPSLQNDLKAEALAIENDASQFKIWPVLQLHVLYRF
jgi:putative salt-induced outer membrane protein YdiY